MSDNENTLSGQIRQEIRHSGFTPRDIEATTGVTQSALSHFLAGRQGMTLDNLDRIARLIGMNVSIQPPATCNPKPHVLSLCDYTGNWSRPWKEAGCKVTLVDLKHGSDVLTYPPGPVDVILAAPPCTDFTVSGGRYWKRKDSEGSTKKSLAIVHACLRLVLLCKPKVWALENPVGRLPDFIGPYQMKFDPCDFGGWLPEDHQPEYEKIPARDAYTKKTCLWGDFDFPAKKRLPPVKTHSKGSWIFHAVRGSKEKRQEIRSITPMGFSLAFYEANKHRVGIGNGLPCQPVQASPPVKENRSQLFRGDCLDVLPTIPDHSVDLILADPPFGTTINKWDQVIPFDKMWEQLHRVAKPHAAIILFGTEPFTSKLVCSNLRLFKYRIDWKKNLPTNHYNAKIQPRRCIEDICVFYDRQCPYNANGNPLNFVEFDTILNYGTSADGKRLHPSQKPLALMEYLIETYSRENDVVLDFCMGAGSTGVAAQRVNRQFIGIERKREFFDIAKARIDGDQA